MNEHLLHRSWAEINLDQIAANTRKIRESVRRSCEILGVVKADAYGHGVKKVAPVLLSNGVTRLAVSMLDEAIELRRSGIDVPILVLSYTDPSRAAEILQYRITQTVYSQDLAAALSAAATTASADARIHIKVDTGMGRFGFLAGYEAIKAIRWIMGLPHIVVEGLFTHFATADEPDDSYTRYQFEQFMGISQELNRVGLHIPLNHVCNSAAVMRFPEMHLDMVRPGLILYGLIPPGCPDAWSGLTPAMSLKSNLILVKSVAAGSSISYGRQYITEHESVIGTIPIGYADGYSRRLSQQAAALVHGRRLPVVGRICMDSCMLDLTAIADNGPKVGDEVVLFGCQSETEACGMISIDEVAEWLNTINYEIICLIGRRVPRAYIKNQVMESVHSYLLHS